MREALEEVKRAFGPNAVILGTRSVPPGALGRLVGRALVEITAAPPETPTPAPRVGPARGGTIAESKARLRERGGEIPPLPHRERDEVRVSAAQQNEEPLTPTLSPEGRGRKKTVPPDDLQAFYVQLVQNEVARDLAARLVQEAAESVARGEHGLETRVTNHRLETGATNVSATSRENAAAVRDALRRYIARMVPAAGGIELAEKNTRRVALIGPPGGGKTTTLAKLAAHFKLRRRKSVALLSLDMNRMGANEQLRRYADIIGVPFQAAQNVGGVKEALETLGTPDLLLIDTPGVSRRERERFVRLAALLRAARPDETHLVLPVSLSASIQQHAAKFFAPLGVSRIALTRLDEAVGLGVILNVTQTLPYRVSYLSDGQNVPQDIKEACSQHLAELILSAPS